MLSDQYFKWLVYDADALEGNEYSEDPNPTLKGIEQAEYDAYRKTMNLPTQTIKNISDEEAIAIYTRNYWQPCQCDYLLSPLDFVVFQCGVNIGTAKAVKILQTVLGITADGLFGQGTMKAVDIHDPIQLSKDFLNGQKAHYKQFNQEPLATELCARCDKTARFCNLV